MDGCQADAGEGCRAVSSYSIACSNRITCSLLQPQAKCNTARERSRLCKHSGPRNLLPHLISIDFLNLLMEILRQESKGSRVR